MHHKIAKQIIQLKNDDLKLRSRLVESGELWNGYNLEMEAMHNRNAKQLDEIINEIGYPSIKKVGEEASEAAWLIIQHAIGQPEFMRKCLQYLEQEVNEGGTNPVNLAYLSDRIANFEGKPQLYGTSFDWDENGELNPLPYDDLAKVNQRRASIGLNSLEEQTLLIRERSRKENESPPANYKDRQAQMNEWRKKVGWIK